MTLLIRRSCIRGERTYFGECRRGKKLNRHPYRSKSNGSGFCVGDPLLHAASLGTCSRSGILIETVYMLEQPGTRSSMTRVGYPLEGTLNPSHSCRCISSAAEPRRCRNCISKRSSGISGIHVTYHIWERP